jgi:hypothetical protein
MVEVKAKKPATIVKERKILLLQIILIKLSSL